MFEDIIKKPKAWKVEWTIDIPVLRKFYDVSVFEEISDAVESEIKFEKTIIYTPYIPLTVHEYEITKTGVSFTDV